MSFTPVAVQPAGGLANTARLTVGLDLDHQTERLAGKMAFDHEIDAGVRLLVMDMIDREVGEMTEEISDLPRGLSFHIQCIYLFHQFVEYAISVNSAIPLQ
jgi:hypothetical protein